MKRKPQKLSSSTLKINGQVVRNSEQDALDKTIEFQKY